MSDSIPGSSGISLPVSILADPSASPADEHQAPSPEDRTESSIDEGLIETFPASDPPARGSIGRFPRAGAPTTRSRTGRLIERFQVARDTLAFRFEKPARFQVRSRPPI